MASLQKAALLFYIWPFPSLPFVSRLAHPTANTSPPNPATAGTSVHPRQPLGEEGNYRHSPSYILHYGVANRSSLTLVSVPSPDDSSRPALVTTVCSDLGVLDLLLPV